MYIHSLDDRPARVGGTNDARAFPPSACHALFFSRLVKDTEIRA